MAVTRTISGRYELREPLGSGGFGIVYRAWDSVLRTEVAVKTLRDVPSRAALDMFHKEGRIVANLNHPNIVGIIDIGEFEEGGQSRPFFVMPLIDGVTLDKLIEDASVLLTPERCVEILAQTCRGLQAATSAAFFMAI